MVSAIKYFEINWILYWLWHKKSCYSKLDVRTFRLGDLMSHLLFVNWAPRRTPSILWVGTSSTHNVTWRTAAVFIVNEFRTAAQKLTLCQTTPGVPVVYISYSIDSTPCVFKHIMKFNIFTYLSINLTKTSLENYK